MLLSGNSNLLFLSAQLGVCAGGGGGGVNALHICDNIESSLHI